MLDIAAWPVALVGDGPATLKRLALLEESGAREWHCYAPSPSPALREAAGARLTARLPTEAEVAALRLLLVAGLPAPEAETLAGWARKHRVLVNVEDVPPLCDAHVPARVRRGDLLLTVSTGGGAPGLAAALRAWLEARFGPEWADRAAELTALRARLRAEGRPSAEVAQAIGAHIGAAGWLPP